MRQPIVPFALAVVALVSVAAGCSENKAPTPAEKAATEQKSVQDIQNDPNLPPAAKESIIRNMQQQRAVAQARGQASGASQAKAAPPGPSSPK